MLISQKLTQDKRVVTDFRHLNVRIAKNNLVYPLDTFSVLGNSKCEVLSVLDLKDAFHLLRLSEDSKRYLQYITIFWKCIIHISKNAYGIKYFTLCLAVLYKHNLRLLTK